MISITVSNATLILGAHAIFRDLNWEIQHDQKIGLIGPNGAGKSSLFKLIIGEHSPEKGGAVIRARGVTVGYLSQHPEFEPEKTASRWHWKAIRVWLRSKRICDELRANWAIQRSITTRSHLNAPSIHNTSYWKSMKHWVA